MTNTVPFKRIELKPIEGESKLEKKLAKLKNINIKINSEKVKGGLKTLGVGLLVTGGLAGGIALAVLVGNRYFPPQDVSVACKCEQPPVSCNCNCYCNSGTGPESQTEPTPGAENPEKTRKLKLVNSNLEQITFTSEMELSPVASGNLLGFYSTSTQRFIMSYINPLSQVKVPQYDVAVMDKNATRTSGEEGVIRSGLLVKGLTLESMLGLIGSGDIAGFFQKLPCPAAISPDGMFVIYPLNEDLAASITDGGGEGMLVDHPEGYLSDLTWMPNDWEVLYQYNDDILLLRNGNALKVTDGVDPSLFPNADRMAYSEKTDNGYRIAIIDMKTGEKKVSDIEGVHPAVSPDGTKIAYLQPIDEKFYSVMMVDSSLENPVTLKEYITEQSPRWSPDNVLAFTYYSQEENGMASHIAFFDTKAESLGDILLKENSFISNISWSDSQHLYLDLITMPMPENANIGPGEIVSVLQNMNSDIYRLNLEFGYE